MVPRYPDQDGRVRLPPNLRRPRAGAATIVRAAGGDRVAVYGLENHDGTPVYVHAKVCVVDDVWATRRLRQPQPALLDPRLRAVRAVLDDDPRPARAA